MTDDLDGVVGDGNVNVIDASADPEYASWDETVPEAKVSGQVIAPFQFYIVAPFKAALKELKAGRTPAGRIGVKVLDGLTGTVGERLFDDLYLGVSLEKYGDEVGPNGQAIKQPKTAAEVAKSTTYFQHSLNRLAKALDLPLKRPVNKSEGALETYLSQFDGADRPAFVVEIGIEPGRNGGAARNRIKWDTARNVSEPALDKKLAAQGKTALDEAKQRISERNAAASKKGASTSAPVVTTNGHGSATAGLD